MAKRLPRFEFHLEAILDAKDAVEWYAERSLAASEKFKVELRRAERRVRESPRLWGPYLHGTRLYRLRGFPYGLVYLERDDRVICVAVAHLKRRPAYWRRRLSQ